MRRDQDEDEDEQEPQQALPVPDGDDDWGQEELVEGNLPATAEEYMRMVRMEAKKVPDIVCKPLDPSKIRQGGVNVCFDLGIVDCGEDLLPLPGWERQFLGDFKALRQRLEK